MKVSLVVPCYNEEKGILSSGRKILDALKSSEDVWEVFFVNDGSLDSTQSKLLQLKEEYSFVNVLSYTVNRGRGKALRTGFKECSGDIVVAVEADLSWGENIPLRLVSFLKQNSNYDMVIASPHLRKGGYRNVSFFRKWLSIVGNKILCLGNSQNLTMVTGMTRAYRKEVLDSLELYSDRKELHLEIVSKVQALGYKIGEIPAILRWSVQRKREMKSRKSSFPVVKLVMSHLVFTFQETPFLFVGGIGFFFTFLGLIGSFYILYLWMMLRLNEGRPLIIFCVLLLLTGIQILVFTFLAGQNKDLKDSLVRLESQVRRNR